MQLPPSSPRTMPVIQPPHFRSGASRQWWHRDIAIWMTEAEANLFRSVLLANQESPYLEFGCGGSTVLAAGIVPRVVSVDNDANFIWLVRRKLLSRPRRRWPRFVSIDQGKLEEWGYPTTEDPRILSRYAETVWLRNLAPPGVKTVLVDGRFRRSCLLHCVLHLGPEVDIFVHDADRYADLISDFFVELASADNLLQLRRRDDIAEAAVRARLQQVQFTKE